MFGSEILPVIIVSTVKYMASKIALQTSYVCEIVISEFMVKLAEYHFFFLSIIILLSSMFKPL